MHAAQSAKAAMQRFLAEVAADGGIKEPEKLAMELQLLLEGSIVLAQSGDAVEAIDVSLDVGRRLIEDAMG